MRRYLTVLLCLCLTACPTDMKDALRQYGYLPVRPASSLWQPGAFVFVKSRSPFEVGIICTAKQMMGADFRPLESVTTNADLAKASKRGITMAAHVEDIVSADAELQSIKNVKMTLRNVKIMEISDFQAALGAQMADKRCLRAIEMRRRQGFDVTLISAAIQADVNFVINWAKSSKLDVDAKVAAVQNLSAKLGVDASSSTDKSIAATGLIWGIRDDQYLAHFFHRDALPDVDRGSSIINPEQIEQLEVMMRTGSESPVPPPGPQPEPSTGHVVHPPPVPATDVPLSVQAAPTLPQDPGGLAPEESGQEVHEDEPYDMTGFSPGGSLNPDYGKEHTDTGWPIEEST